MSKTLVYFDFICPYCYLAKGFILQAEQETGVKAELEWVPWEIHPEFPVIGEALANFLKNGTTSEQRYTQLRKLSCGVREFSPNSIMPNTNMALRVLEMARDEGKAEAYMERVFRASFVEGVNISKKEEVLRLGTEVGLDPKTLLRVMDEKQYEVRLFSRDQEAEELKLEVVPSFVRDDKVILAGSTTMDYPEFKEKFLAIWGK